MREVSTQAHLITRALTRLTADLMEDPREAPLQAAAVRRLHAARGGGARRDLAQVGAAGDGARRLPRRHQRPRRARSRSTHHPGDAGLLGRDRRGVHSRGGRRARACPRRSPTRSSTTTGATATICWPRSLAHHERLGGRTGGGHRSPSSRARATRSAASCATTCAAGSALGHRAFIATPDEVRIDDGRARRRRQHPRPHLPPHLRAPARSRRATSRACAWRPSASTSLNPIASHLEVKAMLGLLSAAAVDDADGGAHRASTTRSATR